jgi:putative transposase
MADTVVAVSHKAFKYRLYPNANQERELGIMLETHRRLYNAALEQRKWMWHDHCVSVCYGGQSAELPDLRASNEWMRKTNHSSCQATLRRLDKAYQRFFERIELGKTPGHPRFKARDQFDSVEFPSYGDGIKLLDSKLRIQHIGTIKVKLHRPVEGRIKTVSFKREADKWYAVFSCEVAPAKIQPSKLPDAGIDVGLESFLTDSDGVHESNPRYLKAGLPALRVAQRAVDRKTKGGKNRKKASVVVRNLHARIRNQRREHHYQTADKLVRRFGFIGVERLAVANMVRNRSLARAISDAGWSRFLGILKHKAEKAGASVMEVDPRGTSQECSGCDKTVSKTLKDRWHSCPHCGLSIHRDHNSALVILARARQARTELAGLNVAAVRARVPRSRRL